MDILNGAYINEIVQVSTVPAPENQRRIIEKRQWFGLSFCRSGQITYKHREKAFVSIPGYAVMIPKGATYELCNDSAGEFPLINFHCTEDAITPDGTFLLIPIKDEEKYFTEYEKMRRLSISKENRLEVLKIFYGILSELSRELTPTEELLSPVIKHIGKNFCDPELDNGQLAKVAGVSEVYLRRLFADRYSTSPHKYIVEMRIERAKQLLSEGEDSVTDISSACGFSGVYHFCRSFKARCGMTPSEYRKTFGGLKI